MQYRLWQPCRFETRQCNSMVNSSNRVLQVQVVDQTTHPPKCHSFVGLDRQIGSSPPALYLELERERTKEEKEREEVLHLFRCYTHTRPERVNPERQEEEKSGHTKGKRPKTAQGGEGNRRTLRNQPTRRNGPGQNSAHT